MVLLIAEEEAVWQLIRDITNRRGIIAYPVYLIYVGPMLKKLLLSVSIAAFYCGCHNPVVDGESDLLTKRRIKIVVTDSGLGGLAVMSDISRELLNSNYYRSAEIIFVNALFDADSGYNSLPSREEKVKMFNRVLKSIGKNYAPDAVVIACNTLSVLLEGNEFIKKSSVPVIGIIEPGVELIYNSLYETERSRVIIFGTETTIEEESHLRALKNLNINEERIITKACPHLQSYIEQNPAGEETEMLINYYVQEALHGLHPDSGPLLISLNCSHYGYAEDLWKTAVESLGYTLSEILNPNYAMSELLIISEERKKAGKTKVSMKVVSKVEMVNIDPVSLLFEGISPGLVLALRSYILKPDLF